MLNKVQMIVLVVLTVYLHLTQAAQFSFNKAQVAISEGGDLPSQISILKSGEINGTISFQVRVISGTATENEDYISNSANPYVFTNDTRERPIRTQLVRDRAGESIDNFMICLPEAQMLRSMGADPVQPTCVTITIVDDDSVVIGFKNLIEAVVEGGTISDSVCAEVKREGLRLDPFDRVPLTVRINPVSDEIQLNTTSIVFEGAVDEQCVTVTVADGDNANMGIRSHSLILERSRETSSVPVEIYPNNISILVIDDDSTETDTSFRIIGPQSIITVLEGNRIEGIRVLRLEDTILTYNITLAVTKSTGSNESAVVIPRSLIFDPSTIERNVEVETLDDTVPEQRRKFNISINGTKVVGAPTANLATAEGEPVTIFVYDNDFEVGITKGEFSSNNIDVCIEIIKPGASDIEPSLSIPITIILESSSADCLLERNILLNATNKLVCVTFSLNTAANCSSMTSYFVQLTWIDDQAGYVVYFPSGRQNATININIRDSTENITATIIGGVIGGLVALGLIIGFTIPLMILFSRRQGTINEVVYEEPDHLQLQAYLPNNGGDIDLEEVDYEDPDGLQLQEYRPKNDGDIKLKEYPAYEKPPDIELAECPAYNMEREDIKLEECPAYVQKKKDQDIKLEDCPAYVSDKI